MYITGYSEDSQIDYPTTAGAFDHISNGGYDVMVTKMDAAGSSLVYSTFLGGSRYDFGSSISIYPDGCTYVTGDTQSNDYPVTAGAYDTLHNGDYDAFVTKLDPTGSSLIFSTFIGGKCRDSSGGITIDPFRNIIITGFTNSSNYPVVNAYDDKYNDDSRWMDAFVTKLDSTGSNLIFSTYVGGSSNDYAMAIALDSHDNICITGFTSSFDYPTTVDAYDSILNVNENMDVFVTKFDVNGSFLIFSTFIGGNDDDFGYGISLDRENKVYITGQTGDYSPEAYSDFPTTERAYDTTYNGGLDIFVTKLNSSGSDLIFSTFIGGSNQDGGEDIIVNNNGDAFITGITESNDYPITKGAEDSTFNGRIDVVVTKLNSSGSFLEYSTYLGGGKRDDGKGIALDDDVVCITGFSFYDEVVQYPTTEGAYQTLHYGEADVIITKLNTTVDNIKPVFGQDLSDENATTGDRFEFKTEVTDDIGISGVFVQFRFGEGTIINRSMSGTGPYRYEINISTHSTESLHYIFRARDLVGNWANTTERTVLVKDNDGPEFLSDLTPSNASTGEPFKFIVSVSDNIAISSVQVEYRFGSEDKNNSTMSLSKENFFLDIEIPRNYSELFYRFSVVDNSSNWNSTTEKRVDVFDLFPPVFIRDLTLNQIGTGEELTFTVEVQDNIGVSSVYVEYWTAGERTNVSMSGTNMFEHQLSVPTNSTEPIQYCFNASDMQGNLASLYGSVTVVDTIPPKAEFVMKSDYNEDKVVTLDGSLSYDNIGLVDWTWFIDGASYSATRSGQTADHTFFNPGGYDVSLKVTDLAGNWDIKTMKININDITPPIARAGKDLVAPEDTEVTFNASVSEDNVGIIEFRWDFVDGIDRVLYGPVPTYIFKDPGIFEIVLTVTDAAGSRGTDNITITVMDITPPTADAGSDQTVLEGTVVLLNGTNSTDNVGISNGIWTIHLGDRDVVLYGSVVSFNFTEQGNYTVTLTVKDGSGNSGSDNVTVTVLPKDIPHDDDNGATGPRYGFLLVFLLLLIIMTCSLVLFLVIRIRTKANVRDNGSNRTDE
ncbi:MAG: PKD domain-containing protein [Candidatus Thermoplasmatota archaeon]|nr:PKD domain-containing protein [Candidatus Thermoplasmatota archaeon]